LQCSVLYERGCFILPWQHNYWQKRNFVRSLPCHTLSISFPHSKRTPFKNKAKHIYIYIFFDREETIILNTQHQNRYSADINTRDDWRIQSKDSVMSDVSSQTLWCPFSCHINCKCSYQINLWKVDIHRIFLKLNFRALFWTKSSFLNRV
jgi:hypothetical protein